MLKITGISKSFGGIKATNNVSIELKPNSINALIGPNGAGKTTIFNLITGKINIDEGKIFIGNNNITNLNLENNTQLFEVTCSDNQLISINLKNGNNTGLWYFMSFNNPNLMCIDVDNIAYCEYTFAVDTWTTFSNNCNPTSVQFSSIDKKLVKITNLQGKNTRAMPNTPLIYFYSDGTIEKKIFIQ